MNRIPKLILATFIALSLLPLPASGQHGHNHDNAVSDPQALGTVTMAISCDEAMQTSFRNALALLHHMMYQQARSSFQAISEAAPDCAMALWGEAMTLFQPLWPERPDAESLNRGWEAISKARELAPESELERQLIDATAGFFQDPDTAAYWERVERWADGMATAYKAHPSDLDTAALYGLSRLAIAGRADNPEQLYDEAEAVLRQVWEEEPSHPGAIHYSIHATDVDGRAKNALDMVEAYAGIAPEVPHALHMPSHIHVRLGNWPEVIEWNRQSSEAATRETVNGALSLHYIHAIDYKVYAYLQQGEPDKARQVYETAMARGDHQPSFAAAFHAAAMPARLAVETRNWEEAAALEPRMPPEQPWDNAHWAEGLTWYAKGLGAIHNGNTAAAREAEKRLEALRDDARQQGEETFATYIEVDRKILSGWLAKAEGNGEEALQLMQAAGDLDATVEKHPITPGALLPPHEALGDALLALGRHNEALAAYEQSDAIWPGRYNTLLGAARAARDNGDDPTPYYSSLLDIAGNSSLPGVREARSHLD